MKFNGLRDLYPIRRLQALSRTQKHSLLVVIAVCCLMYVGFAWRRPVNFSYSGPTCAEQVTLLPDVYRTVDSTQFHVKYQGGIVVGRVRLLATQACFVPNDTPVPGTARVVSGPFGGWLMRSHYAVVVASPPQVLRYSQETQTLNQPLILKLSQTDKVFRYYLDAEGKEQACSVEATQVRCGIDKLGLQQGASYELQLRRSFKNNRTGEATGVKVAIIPAAKVTATSITPGTLVFAKPKSVDLTLDRNLAAATAKLEIVETDRIVAVATRLKVDGTRVLLEWDEDIPRQKTFRLTLLSATGTDGSMLDSAYSIGFETSGGPKVASVNIGGSGVAGNASVLVTFDQPLSANTNIASLAHISGGAAAISRQGNQVVFALRDIPRCVAFTLSIDKGLLSESGVPSREAWSHASRVNCRLTRTIGYSVKGRPIVAYYYGSGSSTILFTGGIHGDEASGSYIMQDWTAHLDANAHKIPAGKQVVIVPSLNPDGLAAGQRYNAHNVNLDRNFPSSDWSSSISVGGGGTLPQGGGTAPLSEPETRAIADLTSSLSVRAEISFHSSGSLVGANKVADSVAIGTTYAAAVGYGKMFDNPEAIFGYTLTGEYETWMGERAGTPAILIELPTSTGRYFSRHQNILWSMVNL